MEEAVELLLVEDNPSDVELTLHSLRKHNFGNRIKVVRDGAEALDFIFGSPSQSPGRANNFPKLILLDLKLTKVSGLEVLGRIKADPSTRRIPIVVLTSSRDDQDLCNCYDLGVNSYLVKPIDFVQFSDAMRQFGLYWLLLNQQPRPQRERSEV